MYDSNEPSPSPSSNADDLNIDTTNLVYREGIQWRRGAFLEALDDWGKWCAAKIVDIVPSTQKVLIHFYKWNQRFDTWYPMISESLRPSVKNLKLSQSSSSSASGTPVAHSPVLKNKTEKIRTTSESKKENKILEPSVTPSLSTQTRRQSQLQTRSSGLQPIYNTDDYVLSKWRNKFDYVAVVRDNRIQEKPRRQSEASSLEYQVQYVCDGVLEWMPENKLKKCTHTEAMQLLNTIPEPNLNIATPKDEEVLYDEATKRFTDSCKDRRRRQRESLDNLPPTITVENSVSAPIENHSIAKRRRTESRESESTSEMIAPLSPLRKQRPQLAEQIEVKEEVITVPVTTEVPAPVIVCPQKSIIIKEEETVKTDFRVPAESMKQPPSHRSIHSRFNLALPTSRPKHKWRGIPAPVTGVRKSSRSPHKKHPFVPLKRGPQLVTTPKRSLGTAPELAFGVSNTKITPSPIEVPPNDIPIQTPPQVANNISLTVPLVEASSLPVPMTQLPINIPPVPLVPVEAVVQYPCKFCKEKNEDRTFRKESLLQAHIKIYHLNSNKQTPSSKSSTARQVYTPVIKKSSSKSTPDRLPHLVSEGESLDSLERTERSSIVYCSRCGSRHETDVMIQCDVCSTWSHMACYDLIGDEEEPAQPPEYWECDSCAGNLRPVRPSRRSSWRHDWMDSSQPSWPLISPHHHQQQQQTTRRRRTSSQLGSCSTPSTSTSTVALAQPQEAGLVRSAAGTVSLAKCLESVARRLRLELLELKPAAPPPAPAMGVNQDHADFDLLQLSLNDDDIPRLLDDVDPLAGLDVVGQSSCQPVVDLTDVMMGRDGAVLQGGGGGVGGTQDSSCGSLQTPGDISASNLNLLDNINLDLEAANLPYELPAVSVADITLATVVPHVAPQCCPPLALPCPALLEYQTQLDSSRSRLVDWLTRLEEVEQTVRAAERTLDAVDVIGGGGGGAGADRHHHHQRRRKRRGGGASEVDARVRLELSATLIKLRAQACPPRSSGPLLH